MIGCSAAAILFRRPCYSCVCRHLSGSQAVLVKRKKPLKPVLEFNENPPDMDPENPYMYGKRGGLRPVRSPTNALEQITVGDYHLQNTDDPKYEKTTVTVLQDDMAEVRLLIDGYNHMGFRMNDARFLFGPICVFPKIALSWKLLNVNAITEDSIQLFGMLDPKPEVVIIGAGQNSEETDAVRTRLIPYFRKLRIGCEILPVDKAAETFNYLNAEKRMVAGLFFPKKIDEFVSEFEEDFDTTKFRHEFDNISDPLFGTETRSLSELKEKVINAFGVGSERQLKVQAERQKEAAEREKKVEEKLVVLEKKKGDKDPVK